MPKYHVCARHGTKEVWKIINQSDAIDAVASAIKFPLYNNPDSVVAYEYNNGDYGADYDWTLRKPTIKATAPEHEWKRGK